MTVPIVTYRKPPAWRRRDVAELRIARLAAAVDDEADRHAEGSVVRDQLVNAAAALREALSLAANP